MIYCPYCRRELHEAAPACPNCNLSLERAKAIMGPIPYLCGTGLTVLSGSLDPASQRPILARLKAFRRRFPQCHPNVLVCRFPEKFPPPTYLFWIFNAGELAEAEQVHGRNRDLLIGVDPVRKTAGLMVGYGLEPFLNQRDLDQVLAGAAPLFQSGSISSGVVDLLDRLEDLMATVCRELPAVLGLPPRAANGNSSADY